MTLPILYSFRRCPYAMRARLAIACAAVSVELREVVLKNKPAAMLAISPKATVPVLHLAGGRVIDESLDIMYWALSEADPSSMLPESALEAETESLIAKNDGEFKHWLDRYKYADRYPELEASDYRQRGEYFLAELESRLQSTRYLQGDSSGLADIALFPFIRQFAHVDKGWFDSADYPALQRWLAVWLASPLFLSIMTKYPGWQQGDDLTVFSSVPTIS